MYCYVCNVYKGGVIEGMDIGVASMKKKELSRFLIQAPYAFGELGCAPRIPPNATSKFSLTNQNMFCLTCSIRVCICAVMFEIEMVSFVDLKVADDFEAYSTEEKERKTLDELISVANAIRSVNE